MKSIFVLKSSSGRKPSDRSMADAISPVWEMPQENNLYTSQVLILVEIPVGFDMSSFNDHQWPRALYFTVFKRCLILSPLLPQKWWETEKTEEKRERRKKQLAKLVTITESRHPKKRIVANRTFLHVIIQVWRSREFRSFTWVGYVEGLCWKNMIWSKGQKDFLTGSRGRSRPLILFYQSGKLGECMRTVEWWWGLKDIASMKWVADAWDLRGGDSRGFLLSAECSRSTLEWNLRNGTNHG